MQELEEDPDMRARVALYKDKQALEMLQAPQAAPPSGMASNAGDSDEDDGEGLPQVPLEELLDDLEALTLAGAHYASDDEQGAGEAGGGGALQDQEDGMSE